MAESIFEKERRVLGSPMDWACICMQVRELRQSGLERGKLDGVFGSGHGTH